MKNTAYKVHVEEVTQYEVDNVNIEQGAMLVTDESLFMGFNGEQVRVYPPQSDKMGLGWARYDDTQYDSNSPYAFTANDFIVPNNSGNIINSHIHSNTAFYYNDKLRAEFENDVFIITIAFKAKTGKANEHIELYLEGGGTTPYDRVKDVKVSRDLTNNLLVSDWTTACILRALSFACCCFSKLYINFAVVPSTALPNCL